MNQKFPETALFGNFSFSPEVGHCSFSKSGVHMRVGIDEVGRGPWAGPLVIGAVILGPRVENLPEYAEIADSKKLTAKKREKLAIFIKNHAAFAHLGWVKSSEIDQIGLGPALKLAARRAVEPLLLEIPANLEIIIDGKINFLEDTPLEPCVSLLPKADFLVKEVGAASIIAKVARDHYMTELDEKYPGYGFSKHVGYGTAAHKKALLDLGPCPEHRLSFRPIAELTGNSPNVVKITTPHKNTTATGQKAELKVAKYLENSGHKIIAHNFKRKSYEIDLISIKDQEIFFTEVKFRHDIESALEAVTEAKQAQIHRAAEAFLASHPELQKFTPRLAVAGVDSAGKIEWFVL